jgi:RHS repeat-associated protein
MGNIDLMSTDGGFALTGDYRAAGRPNSRKITLPMAGGTSKTLERTYQYKQGTGQLLEMKAMVGNIPVAGSTVHYDGLLVDDAALIGVSGGVRHTRHSYDRRGRLSGSVVAAAPEVQAPAPGAAASAPGSTSEALDPADFRTGQTRAPLLDPTVASLLQSRGIDTAAIDPPSQSAMPARGHKIATFTRGASTRTFDFALKSELVDDGLFRYHYDAKGRLDWAAEKATATGVVIRRILYAYDGNNRLVGRTAQSATVTSLTANYDTFAWSLETRQAILDADGIPAETTFVWDPISDRIITVVRAGDSKIASDPNNNVLKQIIHGDMGYDDPLEVTTLDAAALVAPGQPKPVTKLYPIYDEAAGGTLQVVVNRDGEVVARSVNNDPFGGSEFDLAGAAIDHVEIQTKKRADGALDSVAVTMRATEPLATASVASGARLAVVDANGALVRPSTVEPALAANDPFTVTWTLSAAEWTALSDATAVNNRTPVALSIAATDTLHAALWRFDLPILPAPDWATTSQPVFSSTTLPVEVREPLAAISSTIAALTPNEFKTTTPYDVPNLSLVGTSGNSEVESLLAATFQAQPFAEPFTHKFYVRERWYDPMTGTWLSPDPLGYVDSANLYAYAGGDPVNRRDPRGEATNLEKGAAGEAALFQWLRDEGWKVIQGPGHRTNAGGADAVAYLPGKTVAYNVNTGEMELVDGEMGVVTFFDDKNWARKKIGKAPALTENFERGENVENAIEAVTKSEELSSVEKAQIIQILRDGNFQKLISSAAKESKVEGITTLLKKKGIGFLSKNKVNIVIAIIVAAFAEDKTEAFVEALDPVAAISGGTEVASSKEESHSVLEVNAFRPLIRELRRRGVNVGGPHTPHPTAPISAEDDKRRLEELEKNVWKGMGPK